MKEQILKLRAEGRSYKEIAEIVGCVKGTISYYCNPNSDKFIKQRARRNRIKQECVDYLGGECLDCGYHKNIAALEFHHIDPSSKEFSISSQRGYLFTDLKKELDKCILLCANCHRELHSNQQR